MSVSTRSIICIEQTDLHIVTVQKYSQALETKEHPFRRGSDASSVKFNLSGSAYPASRQQVPSTTPITGIRLIQDLLTWPPSFTGTSCPRLADSEGSALYPAY